MRGTNLGKTTAPACSQSGTKVGAAARSPGGADTAPPRGGRIAEAAAVAANRASNSLASWMVTSFVGNGRFSRGRT